MGLHHERCCVSGAKASSLALLTDIRFLLRLSTSEASSLALPTCTNLWCCSSSSSNSAYSFQVSSTVMADNFLRRLLISPLCLHSHYLWGSKYNKQLSLLIFPTDLPILDSLVDGWRRQDFPTQLDDTLERSWVSLKSSPQACRRLPRFLWAMALSHGVVAVQQS